MLVIINMLVIFEIIIIIKRTTIIAIAEGIFFSLNTLYKGSKMNDKITAIKKGINIDLSSLSIIKATTTISM
jgi:hypothetical protein